jgi:hypothetical protein
MMTLHEELGIVDRSRLFRVHHIDHVSDANNRVDEIVEFISSSDGFDSVMLSGTPAGELGHRASQAIFSNPRVTELISDDLAMRDLIRWIVNGRGTLEHMKGLTKIIIHTRESSDTFVKDWDVLSGLLLTSTTLQTLRIVFMERCANAFMTPLARYLGCSFLVNFRLSGIGATLSQAAFMSLCDGVAKSSLRKLSLECNVVGGANLETAAESLTRAIAESSLEEVALWSASLRLALLRTAPDQNLAFVLSQHGDGSVVRVNRKWKPLLTNPTIPLGLWPRILETALASPRTSHGPAGILFFLLREKPDLVPTVGNRLQQRPGGPIVWICALVDFLKEKAATLLSSPHRLSKRKREE